MSQMCQSIRYLAAHMCCLRVARAYRNASIRPGEVGSVLLSGPDEAAYVVQVAGTKPALLHTLGDGIAIGLAFVRADKFVAALVVVNPELHRCGRLRHHVRAYDDELRERRRVIIEMRVEHRRHRFAADGPAIERVLSGRHQRRAEADERSVVFRRGIGRQGLGHAADAGRQDDRKRRRKYPRRLYVQPQNCTFT